MLCVVQSTDCSSQEGKAMFEAGCSGQLGVVALSWLMAPGVWGTGWGWPCVHQLCWERVPLLPLPQ